MEDLTDIIRLCTINRNDDSHGDPNKQGIDTEVVLDHIKI